MDISASIRTSILANVQASYNGGGGRGRTNQVNGVGRRGLILSAVVSAATQVDSRAELLQKYLKKSEENKEKNDKERLESYYKRNYRDYFGVFEGTLKQKKELTESEKDILEWLEQNK
ncbi:hypothetical protein M9H77_34366 [Catharanthus roseus]|uniref:Uncharacterized protein n=1 Tax=Catharanthus roseus TaxID=4058 RepID=A0ACB9ZM67_CATRO|nr:hypothetical protein M9H77_34366 [Catharanthus roseus]